MKSGMHLKAGGVILVLLGFALAASLTARRTPAQEPADCSTVNGVNSAVLKGVVEAMKEHPELGRLTLFARTRWQDGMRMQTSIRGYKLDGEMLEQEERHFLLLADEGENVGGTGAGPNPVEALMHALGACVAAETNMNAVLMGVELDRLEVTTESDLDVHGFMTLDPKVRPGVQNLRVTIAIGGNADKATLEKIARAGYQYSPVADTLRNGTKLVPTIKVVD